MIIYFSLDKYQILLFPQACKPIEVFTDSCMYDKDKKGTTGFGGNDFIKVSKTSYVAEIETTNGPQREKTCLRGFANNKGADQTAHSQSGLHLCCLQMSNDFIKVSLTSYVAEIDTTNTMFDLIS